ncbi:MAG: hypothetical protein KME26_07585 [Oscillatoria princeps RMCB-10]|jgi:tetratricopeptide (TPR) repeat protein|nr:hypothetical protein [Oscillatoria princeps RMCB-10]
MNWIRRTIAILGIAAAALSVAPVTAFAQTTQKQPVPVRVEVEVETVEANDFVKLARNAFAVKDYQNAVFQANRALDLDPELAEGYLLRGQARTQLGQRQPAVKDLQQAAVLYWQQKDRAGYNAAVQCLWLASKASRGPISQFYR